MINGGEAGFSLTVEVNRKMGIHYKDGYKPFHMIYHPYPIPLKFILFFVL